MIRPGAEIRRPSHRPPRVRLETRRLLLEPVGTQHAAGIYAAVVASRPELLPWMPWAPDPTLEGTLATTAQGRLAWRDAGVYHFAVLEKGSGDVVGVAGLNHEGPGVAELHYWIRTDRAGQGLATEAGRALIDWARDGLRLERLTLWAGRENTASRRVAEKLGFSHIGSLGWRPEGGLGDFEAESYHLPLTPSSPPAPQAV